MLRVIGAGFGRTGTTSLKKALEQLGFGPCYHFTEMLKRGHVGRWLAVAEHPGGLGVDWDRLFRGYASVTDWPAAAYYRELAAHYPDAKLILSVRDPGDWHASIGRTLLPMRRALVEWMPWFGAIARLTDVVVWDGVFDGRATDRQYAIDVFERHCDEVRAAFPDDRLLVFDVREGWAPLCDFLDVPVPENVSFPRSNDTRTIRRTVWLLRALRYALPVLIVFGLLIWLLRGYTH